MGHKLIHPDTEPDACSYSSCSSGRSSSEWLCHSVRWEIHPENHGSVCFHPVHSPLLTATVPDSAPALINSLQTATLTRSASHKANSQSRWPSTSRGAKPSQHPSGTHPSVRGYTERGHISPPSFTSHLHLTHAHLTDAIIYEWLYL